MVHSGNTWAAVLNAAAGIAEVGVAYHGMEAGFDRRRQGWEHQRDLVDNELVQIDKQIKAAEIRRDIAIRSQELHQMSIAQIEEIDSLYDDCAVSELVRKKWVEIQERLICPQNLYHAQC